MSFLDKEPEEVVYPAEPEDLSPVESEELTDKEIEEIMRRHDLESEIPFDLADEYEDHAAAFDYDNDPFYGGKVLDFNE